MLRLPTRHVLPALPPREARQLQLWLPRHGRRWYAHLPSRPQGDAATLAPRRQPRDGGRLGGAPLHRRTAPGPALRLGGLAAEVPRIARRQCLLRRHTPHRRAARPIRCPPPATDGLHGRRPRRAAPVRMDLHRRGARQRHAPPGDGAGCRGRAAGAQLAARKRLPLPCRRATENRAAVRGGLQGVPPRRGAVPMGELTRQAYSCLLSCVHL
mmetsp:Transcript_33029/g.109119  ORF Transcript_33029/g.109119 Transcript_33029/m.109119 type:complete len:212 (-) Transcript_33029:69-704(-)